MAGSKELDDRQTRGTAITGAGDPRAPIVSSEPLSFDARFLKRDLLGRGGMGEVFACEDRAIGREVALKTIRADHLGSAEHRMRFLREACIQAQLEHPAIVPIHDVGNSSELGPYFVMKRVRGTTLREVLNALASGDEAAKAKYTRSKLLSAFRQLGLAIDYAHARGVVHRDLKPSNVMLGDYGEVHVLDWGLAKHIDRSEIDPNATLQGVVLGTPGYMAPEQAGDAAEVDPRTDVYALGAILYEILTLQRLAPRRSDPDEANTAPVVEPNAPTLIGDGSLAPELEAICRRATRTDPAGRFRSVHDLIDALDLFLEGDRDLELRRSLAKEKAAAAGALVDRALTHDPATEDTDRARAMREVSSALALDPENLPARHALMRLLLHPPSRLPEAVARKLDESWAATLQNGARGGFFFLMTLTLVFLPLVVSMGIRDARTALAYLAIHVALMAGAAYHGFVRPSSKSSSMPPQLLLALCAVVVASRLFGPLIVVPNLAAGFLTALLFHARKHEVTSMIAMTVLFLLVPVALEYAGVLPRSYSFTGDAMLIRAQIASFEEAPAMLFLIGSTLAAAMIPALNLWRLRRALDKAQEELALRAWYLDTLSE
jgi:eukaryotic-like serine/threonine-protein kinase